MAGASQRSTTPSQSTLTSGSKKSTSFKTSSSSANARRRTFETRPMVRGASLAPGSSAESNSTGNGFSKQSTRKLTSFFPSAPPLSTANIANAPKRDISRSLSPVPPPLSHGEHGRQNGSAGPGTDSLSAKARGKQKAIEISHDSDDEPAYMGERQTTVRTKNAARASIQPTKRKRSALVIESQSQSSPSSSASPEPVAVGRMNGRGKHQYDAMVEDHIEDDPSEYHRAKPFAASASKPLSRAPNERDPFSTIWADSYAPRNRSELSLHPKKLLEVENWLREALDGPDGIRKYRRMLALTGPAGCCKSTAVDILSLAEELDFQVISFSGTTSSASSGANGSNDDFGPAASYGVGLTEKFAEFALTASYSRRLALTAPETSSADRSESKRTVRFEDGHAPGDLEASTPASVAMEKRKKVIVIDEFPNLSHAGTKESFHAALEALLKTPLQPDRTLLDAYGQRKAGVKGLLNNVPVIVIISESTPRSSDETWAASAANGGAGSGGWKERMNNTWDVRSVLSEGIRNHPAFAEIKFNPIATTIMKQALKRIAQLALLGEDKAPADKTSPQKPKGRRKKKADDEGSSDSQLMKTALMLSDDISKRSDGDLRSAVNALQMTLRMAASGELPAEVASEDTKSEAAGRKKQKLSSGKAKTSSAKLTTSAQVARLMTLVTERESSLALWHAIGKVLYNKREGEEKDEADRQRMRDIKQRMEQEEHAVTWQKLPHHLSHLRRKVSLVDVEAIWTQVSCEPSSFQLFLHHNFPNFCEEIDECADVLEQYSCADSDMHVAHERWQSASLSSYYSFLVSTHGTLLHLPSPVPRRNQKLRNTHFWDATKRSKSHMDDLLDAQTYLLNKARPKFAAQGSASLDGSSAAADQKTFCGSSMSELAMEIVPILSKMGRLDDHGLPDTITSLGRIAAHNVQDDSDLEEDSDAEQDAGPVAAKENVNRNERLSVSKKDLMEESGTQSVGLDTVPMAIDDQEEQEDALIEGDDIGDFDDY